MVSSLWFRYRRRRCADTAARSPLQTLYEQSPADPRTPLADVRFLVVDCEMSGLDARKDKLLSIGWVLVENMRVVNASGRQLLIHAEQITGHSSTIHGLMDSTLAGAGSAASAIMALARQIPGSILVFHHAPLDLKFLQQASKQNFRCPLLFQYVDTMEIESRRLRHHPSQSGLRLAQCRERYNLPVGAQHDALADAIATAELLLAQLGHMAGGRSQALSDLPLHTS